MKSKIPQKLYVVKKYIFARSASEAISKDKKTKVYDCWVDEDYKKQLVGAIGFAHYNEEE